MNKTIRLILSLFVAVFLGLVVGLYAQSNSAARLAKLSEEKAEISKMDLVLINTRIGVLQQTLKEDLGVPFTPTSFSYDADKKKIRIAVYIASTLLVKANASQLSKTLETRGTALCVAPNLAEGNFRYMFPVQPPKDYCAIRFFTDALSPAGELQTKDVATYEDGKLTLN